MGDYIIHVQYTFTIHPFNRLLTEVTGTRQALKHDKTLSRLPRPSSPSPLDKQQTSYAKTSLQLLDLLDTMYIRTGGVFGRDSCSDGEGVSGMWHMCWCPLLEVSRNTNVF